MNKIGITSPPHLQQYVRWWKSRYLLDGRQIKEVYWVGGPAGFSGDVWLELDDGSTIPVPIPARNVFRPRKKDLIVFDELYLIKNKQ